MKKAIIGAFVVFIALGALSCDEAKKMYVEGNIQTGVSTSTISFLGSLGEGGADNYGTCSYSDEKFDFTIGTSKMGDVNSSSEIYLEVSGVQGPPIEGVFDENGDAKDDEEISFGFIRLRTGANTFSFAQTDEEVDPDICNFEMFAEAVAGELTPEGGKKFNYYVSLSCMGLSDVTSGDTPLNSVTAEFYFTNCD